MKVLYEDNHLIIVEKEVGEIVQGDKTGDKPLSETVKEYLKEKYSKPGNVFCGVVHRLDRPVSGIVVFAKTSKGLERMNKMFRDGEVRKKYRAVVEGHPKMDEELLENWLWSDQRINKTFISKGGENGSKLSRLRYKVIARGIKYSVVEIELLTGRKHQIRAQMSGIGHPIKGDLKYGAKRSNPGGGISLQSYSIDFIHPVSKESVHLSIPPTAEMEKLMQGKQ